MSVLAHDPALREAVRGVLDSRPLTVLASAQELDALVTDVLNALAASGNTVQEYTHRLAEDDGTIIYGMPVQQAVAQSTIDRYGEANPDSWSVVTRQILTLTGNWTPAETSAME